MLVLNAEARRKDHWQMMTHHVVTVALMLGSYFYNYTRIGVLVMLLMDAADVWMPVSTCIIHHAPSQILSTVSNPQLAKMFRYLSFLTLCDITFGLFMVSWFVTRHALFIVVIISVWRDSSRYSGYTWDPSRGYFMTAGILNAFNGMLICLEVSRI